MPSCLSGKCLEDKGNKRKTSLQWSKPIKRAAFSKKHLSLAKSEKKNIKSLHLGVGKASQPG